MKSWNAISTLIEREFYRFFRLAGQTIAPPVIMTILFIVIFGYSLGSRIREISGFSYIIYIIPGLAGMGVINNAYANCTTSLFMARSDRSIENILVTPISYIRIVSSMVMGGMARGMIVGGITVAVAVPLTGLEIASIPATIGVMILVAICFASFGVINGLWAESWDHVATVANFVITPFIYLGGVFYSISMLPPTWRQVSAGNPLYYMIDSMRWAILGSSDIDPSISISIIAGLALITFSTAVYLFRRGYKLVV